jgi:hypothetical protein
MKRSIVMSPAHPLRALRSSGRRARAAGTVVLAGLVAVTFQHAPASAHGTGRHNITIVGQMKITDVDDFGKDVVCTIPFSHRGFVQKSAPMLSVEFVKPCDEVTSMVRVNVRWRSDTNVDTDGLVEVKERDCYIPTPFCSIHTVGKRDFRATVAENFVQRYGPVTIGDDWGATDFEFTVLANSP